MQQKKNNTIIKCVCPNCGICFKEIPSLQNPNIYILKCQKCGWLQEDYKINVAAREENKESAF